ncbi:MAG: cob(I)yrinic acid a,c-diamide adenosyltransferase [Gammaproteobacteria bacterium]
MADRLTKIYTRSGDAGLTGLANGERVPKSDARIEAFGTVDETNSAIGLVLSGTGLPAPISDSLSRIQDELFDVGAELALPGHTAIGPEYVLRLENELDELNSTLPPLKEFILPGGSPAAAACHMARATCRRAERRAWTFSEAAEVNPELLKYLNRLSDLLFVIARVLAREDGSSEVLWRSGRR